MTLTIFSCERPNEAMKEFMTKTSMDCRAACDASTMPFYTLQNGMGIQCGTGVLVQIGERHFIVTAAHTMDKLKLANLDLRMALSMTC
jgi:hypothetical protein